MASNLDPWDAEACFRAVEFDTFEQAIDPPQQMIGRDVVLETEIVEELALIARQTSHQRPALLQTNRKTESQHQGCGKSDFINGIDPILTLCTVRSASVCGAK